MNAAWQTVRIGDLGRVVTGKTPSSERPDEFGDAYPFITPSDIDNTSKFANTGRYLSEAGANTLRNALLPANAVCVACIGSIGKIIMTDRPSFTNQQINSVIVDRRRFDPNYVYYLCKTITETFQIFSGGAATPIINKTVFSSIKVNVPDLVTQQRLAAVLSSLDDLIANNQRRIALLESMAEEIYREWFVRMRFPGADKAKFEKGLPTGWTRQSLKQVAEVDPLEARRPGHPAPFVPMDRLSTNTMHFDVNEVRSDWAGSKFRNHDVLLPRITPSLENGKRGYVACLQDDEVAVGSTEFIVLRAKLIAPEHLYFVSISDGFRKHAELSMTGASGRQRVQDDCFNFFLVPIPPPDITEAFIKVIRPMFEQVVGLAKLTKKLAELRDSLLPRLISGKLRIDHLDIQYPPSMKAEFAEAV